MCDCDLFAHFCVDWVIGGYCAYQCAEFKWGILLAFNLAAIPLSYFIDAWNRRSSRAFYD